MNEEKYKRVKEIYDSLRKEEDGNIFKRIYYHEIVGTIGALEGLKKFVEEGELEEKVYQELKEKNRENIEKLYELRKIKDLKPSELKTKFSTDISKYIEIEKRILRKKGIEVEIEKKGNSLIRYEPAALRALISTHFGDCINWSPEGEKIKVTLKETMNTVKMTLENKFGETRKKEEGTGEKIGSAYTDAFLDSTGTKLKKEILEEKGKYNTFKKTFIIKK